MLQTIILLVAAAGVALIAYLLVSGRGDHSAWHRETRVRVRRESSHVKPPAGDPTEIAHTTEEGQSIEVAWEHERARSALQEAEPDRWPLRNRNG
jgi:hypothetical protein